MHVVEDNSSQAWYDGHHEMEQALVRFGHFVNDIEGNGGESYVVLAKFLLDNRDGGSEYDQSQGPMRQQLSCGTCSSRNVELFRHGRCGCGNRLLRAMGRRFSAVGNTQLHHAKPTADYRKS